MSLMSSSLVLCHCLSYHTMRFVPSEGKKDNKRRRSWWQRFFFDDDDVNWLGLRDDDIVDEMSDEEKLETWKRRADAHCEVTRLCWSQDRVFAYASSKSVSCVIISLCNIFAVVAYVQFFLAILIVIPWALDFLAHDYVCTHALFGLVISSFTTTQSEASPPLSDDDLWWELRGIALAIVVFGCEKSGRLENRKAFANIWSDMVFGISLFCYFVALLKVYRISDTGKAFLIILVTDIFLG
ncbi:hypothetical protein Bca4012_007893 [Brassica carinata]|uniref:Transmembrane protein n=1 Tax=Brassica carinata TaxID=52824 RepID=A0A8X7UV22_BRACI|nr:hypothetical protein Bca52824_038586 [Brassica carinata]